MRNFSNGLGVLAAGLQLLHPGHLQHPTNPVIPNNESFWITQVEEDLPKIMINGNSLLKPAAFFNLGTAYVTYVPIEQRIRDGEKDEKLEFTPEQQSVYDEISAIYGLYGVGFKFSKEGVFDQSKAAGDPVTYPSEVTLVTPEGKDRLLSKALTILYTLYGENIYKYVNKVVDNKGGSFFQVIVGDKDALSREILIDTARHSSFSSLRDVTLHEGVHAVEAGYKAHTLDEYLAIQLIKAKITLLLTDPHSVWNEHYSSRYRVWYYSPYIQIGDFVEEHKDSLISEVTDYQVSVLGELLDYAEGLGSDGFLSETDKIYIGLKAFELKQNNPEVTLPPQLEEVLSDSLYRISTECFADIVSNVLLGSGYFSDPEILALIQEFIDIARPDGEQISLEDLIYKLRYDYYAANLPIPRYARQDPQE